MRVTYKVYFSIALRWRINELTNAVDHSPSPEGRSNILSISQEIPCIFWNVKVRHRFHNSTSLVPVRSQINLAHALPSCIRVNIFLPSPPRFLKWSLFFFFPRLPHQSLVCIYFLPHVLHILCPSDDKVMGLANGTWKVMGLANGTWPKSESEYELLFQKDDGIMMVECFEYSYGAARENGNVAGQLPAWSNAKKRFRGTSFRAVLSREVMWVNFQSYVLNTRHKSWTE